MCAICNVHVHMHGHVHVHVVQALAFSSEGVAEGMADAAALWPAAWRDLPERAQSQFSPAAAAAGNLGGGCAGVPFALELPAVGTLWLLCDPEARRCHPESFEAAEALSDALASPPGDRGPAFLPMACDPVAQRCEPGGAPAPLLLLPPPGEERSTRAGASGLPRGAGEAPRPSTPGDYPLREAWTRPPRTGYGHDTVAASAGAGFVGGVVASGTASLLLLLALFALLVGGTSWRWRRRWRRDGGADRSARAASRLVVYEDQVLGTGSHGSYSPLATAP